MDGSAGCYDVTSHYPNVHYILKTHLASINGIKDVLQPYVLQHLLIQELLHIKYVAAHEWNIKHANKFLKASLVLHGDYMFKVHWHLQMPNEY